MGRGVILGLLLHACTWIPRPDAREGREVSDPGAQTEADADSDADTDADSDTDTDADSDADTDTDTDTDTDAVADSDADTDLPPSSACADELISALPATIHGSTAGAGNDTTPATPDCTNADGEDYAFELVAPTTTRYLFDTTDSPLSHHVYVTDGCSGDELACAGYFDLGGFAAGWGVVVVPLDAGQLVIVTVDAYGGFGNFTLEAIELPAHELDCADALDEDFDGTTDCLDSDCAGMGSCAPVCPDLSLGTVPGLVAGSTIGQPDEADPSCSIGDNPDQSVQFTAPSTGRYLFETSGGALYPALSVTEGCGGAELSCGYGEVFADLDAGQSVVLVIEGSYGAAGEYELEVVEVPLQETDCADGRDEDYDNFADCFDPDCAGVGSCGPLCPDYSLDAVTGHVEGTTRGQPSETSGSCSFGGVSPDASVQFTAPADGLYAFALSTLGTDFDTLLYVTDGCWGAELFGACDDVYGEGLGGGEVVVADLLQGQTVVAVVDGYYNESGDFDLHVFAPTSTEVGRCGDGLDNDLDSDFDCRDFDCAGDPACVEDCDTGLDEDLDGQIDCLDFECAAAPSCVEICPQDELVGALPLEVEGNTSGSADDYTGSCGSLYATSDTTWRFVAPAAGTYTFDTIGTTWDTVLYVLDGADCAGVELACDDDTVGSQSEVEVVLAEGQEVVVVVDGYSTYSAGDYVLHVHQ
jgi:hypothetical protein